MYKYSEGDLVYVQLKNNKYCLELLEVATHKNYDVFIHNNGNLEKVDVRSV